VTPDKYVIKIAFQEHENLVLLNSDQTPRTFDSEEEAEEYRLAVWPENSRVEQHDE